MEAIINYLWTILSVISLQQILLVGGILLAFGVCYASEKRSITSNATNSNVIEQLENTLSCFTTYGCSDAPRFPHCIQDEKREEILNRYKNIPQHKLRFEAEANRSAAVTPGNHYSDFRINRLSKLIDQATSGCCTTLAISATQKLLKLIDEELPNHRIEMVSSDEGMASHCYIIFDRVGEGCEGLREIEGEDGKSYPTLYDWGNQVLIIDPWAQSLGHGNGVYTLENYPFKCYLANLTQTYDSRVDHINSAAASSEPKNRTPSV